LCRTGKMLILYRTVSLSHGGEILSHLHPRRFTSLLYRHPDVIPCRLHRVRRAVNYNGITDSRVLSWPFVWNYIAYTQSQRSTDDNIFEVRAGQSIWNKSVTHGSMVAMGTAPGRGLFISCLARLVCSSARAKTETCNRQCVCVCVCVSSQVDTIISQCWRAWLIAQPVLLIRY